MENELKYTKRFINRNFRLKVYGYDSDNRRINKLVGVQGLDALIGAEFINKFIGKALESGKDCSTHRLRRGLQVSLYAK